MLHRPVLQITFILTLLLEGLVFYLPMPDQVQEAQAATPTLTGNDITHLGAFKTPACSPYSLGQFAGRYIGGSLHFFCAGSSVGEFTTVLMSNVSPTGATLADASGVSVGDWTTIGNGSHTAQIKSKNGNTVTWSPALPSTANAGERLATEEHLYEYAYPGTTSLATTLDSALTATFVRDWGQYLQGRRVNSGGAQQYIYTHHLFFDGTAPCPGGKIGMYWTYRDHYNSTANFDPSIGLSCLDDATHTVTTYGPWYFSPNQRSFGGLTRIPAAWASAHLGNGNCLGVSSSTGSGQSALTQGNSLFAICNPPTWATPPNSSATAFATRALVDHDYHHRQVRDNNIYLVRGSVQWDVIVSNSPASPTTTCAYVDADPNTTYAPGYEGALGAPAGKPYNIFFKSLGIVRAVTSINGRKICYANTITPPAVGEHIFDSANDSIFGHFPAVKFTSSEPTDWISYGVGGEGKPAVGYFTQVDGQGDVLWIDGPKASVLFAGILATGDVWYGSVYNSGRDHESPGTGGQGQTSQGVEPTITIWNPDTFLNVLSGAPPYSIEPSGSVRILTDKGLITVSDRLNYPYKGSPRTVTGQSWFDPTTNLLFVNKPEGYIIGCCGGSAVVNVYYINTGSGPGMPAIPPSPSPPAPSPTTSTPAPAPIATSTASQSLPPVPAPTGAPTTAPTTAPTLTAPVTDNFNRADSISLGVNWRDIGQGIGVSGNTASERQAGFTDGMSYWTANAFNNNQYSEAVVSGLGYVDMAGVCVRMSGAWGTVTGNMYCYVGRDTSSAITKTINNTTTTLQGLGALSSGDVLRLEVQGTTLRAYRNGVQQGSAIADSSIASGAAGIWFYGNQRSNAKIDNWSAGNAVPVSPLTTAPVTAPAPVAPIPAPRLAPSAPSTLAPSAPLTPAPAVVMPQPALLPQATIPSPAPAVSQSQAPAMSGISVTQASPGRDITVSWMTNVPTTGLLEYATTAAALNPPAGYSKFQQRMQRVLDKSSASTSMGTVHSITIPGAQFPSNTQIYYTIKAVLPNGLMTSMTPAQSFMTK